jgi:sialate O-acetylesterase
LNDVYIGEVWLASGQSNMDFTVAKTPKYYFAGVKNEEQEVAAANYPQIRMFKGDWTMSYTPQSTAPGSWKACTPENVREFSAVGYFFARALHKELKVPVGIIAQTYGASTAEAWVRREALQTIPEMKTRLDAFDAQVQAFTPEEKSKYEAARAAWQIEADKATAAGTRAPRAPRNPDPVQDQHNPTVLYNGMIAGLAPYGIRGVLWYQGESVLDGAAGIRLYPKVQETLVRDWRAQWSKPDLPFYNVQLAGYERASAQMRAAQATVLSLPHTGMAVTIDIGDRTDVHPRNKQAVGERLARIALANAYGRDIESSGPVFQSMQIEGNTIRLRWSHVGGGLVAKGSDAGELKTFEIAGNDGKFVPANARIDGDTVVVSSSNVASPVTVRYAWQGFPAEANLFNKAGLPAGPFMAGKQPEAPTPATTPNPVVEKTNKPEKRVAFRPTNAGYVTATAGGRLTADGKRIESGQTFVLLDLNGGDLVEGDSIQLDWAPSETRPTHWREGEKDGEGIIQRVGTKPDAACIFRVKFKANPDPREPRWVLLQTASGKYVTVSPKTRGLVPTTKEADAANFEMSAVQ